MKRILPAFAVWLIVTAVALAHVGSPNVFFEGQAGDYAVHAIIRPPAALPGAAQVSLSVDEADVRSVSLLPVLWQAGREGSPQPVTAQRVPGETNLWSGEVWFLYPGSYTVQVSIEGSRGSGGATVPVNVIGTDRQPMKTGLRIVLSVLGLILFVGAAFIVGAVTREGSLETDAKPAALHSRRGHWAAGMAVLLLAAGVVGGAVRWRNMDLAYRTQGIQKPEPVAATVRAAADRVIVELRQSEQNVSRPPWSALVPDHGKLMHLFLVREPELNVFAHLHPVRRDAHTFALDAPALPAGGYQLYGDVTFENGISQTLVAQISLPAPVGRALVPPSLVASVAGELFCGSAPVGATSSESQSRDADDSWHVDPVEGVNSQQNAGEVLVARLMGGYRLLFENAAAVAAGRETSLRFAAIAPNGSGAALQPYMGMLGHAAVRRADGSVFAHLHPSGSFSMAAQEAFRQRGNSPGETAKRASGQNAAGASTPSVGSIPSNRVSFPYEFPKAGPYRLWIQVRVAGRVLTAVFDLEIKSRA